jgi:hypothetical protein
MPDRASCKSGPSDSPPNDEADDRALVDGQEQASANHIVNAVEFTNIDEGAVAPAQVEFGQLYASSQDTMVSIVSFQPVATHLWECLTHKNYQPINQIKPHHEPTATQHNTGRQGQGHIHDMDTCV